MKFVLLEKGKDTLKVQVEDLDETLFYPLINELQNDEAIAEARYYLGHPTLEKPVISVKVKTGKPQAALKRALKALSNQFKEAREQFEKEMKE
jgi:DNA-directed RNA polymerase subunit L